MDVVVWLRSLGLEEYEAAFRDNKINERVLPNLIQEDLKEIGVGPVGHRRIILEAIAALRADAGGKASSADATTTSTAPSIAPEDRADGAGVVGAVGSLKIHAPLKARVSIATGLVVVGDLIGSGASQEKAIVGETPNLAARLQGIAEPNSVVIAESTRKLVGNLFELQDLGSQDLKGIAGPVGAWAALRPSSVESRFDALHAGGLIELVGREEELEILLRRWSKAEKGEGQVVLLSGEPGIGKSRLTAALLEQIAEEPHTRLRYFCSPQHTDSMLYPIICQMQRAAGFIHDDKTEANSTSWMVCFHRVLRNSRKQRCWPICSHCQH